MNIQSFFSNSVYHSAVDKLILCRSFIFSKVTLSTISLSLEFIKDISEGKIRVDLTFAWLLFVNCLKLIRFACVDRVWQNKMSQQNNNSF